MKTISMLEFRHKAESILAMVQKGQRLILTYRGKPVARLEPISADAARPDDPFYRLAELADDTGKALTNQEMDEIVYCS